MSLVFTLSSFILKSSLSTYPIIQLQKNYQSVKEILNEYCSQIPDYHQYQIQCSEH